MTHISEEKGNFKYLQENIVMVTNRKDSQIDQIVLKWKQDFSFKKMPVSIKFSASVFFQQIVQSPFDTYRNHFQVQNFSLCMKVLLSDNGFL